LLICNSYKKIFTYPSRKRTKLKIKSKKKIIIKKELKRKEELVFQKTLTKLLKTSKEIPKDGTRNGKERGIKRREKEEEVKHKV